MLPSHVWLQSNSIGPVESRTLRPVSGMLIRRVFTLVFIACLTNCYGRTSRQWKDLADRPCEAFETEVQSMLFQKFWRERSPIPFSPNCPTQLWMDIYHALHPHSPATFIDIGCNKGYTSADIFSRWAPHVQLTPKYIERVLEDCGACSDCLSGPASKTEVAAYTYGLLTSEPSNRSESITVHCIEASQRSYARLQSIHEGLPNQDASGAWKLHNFAAAKVSGEVAFPTGCDTELCSIQADNSGVKTRAVSVDDFVRAERMDNIALLKIDTEGFDPDVIAGARHTIVNGKATVIYFEYHNLNLWANVALKTVVAELESAGYACFLDGSPTLTRLDAQCWHNIYEFKQWSNVVCVKKASTELFVAFERLSFRNAHFMHLPLSKTV